MNKDIKKKITGYTAARERIAELLEAHDFAPNEEGGMRKYLDGADMMIEEVVRNMVLHEWYD